MTRTMSLLVAASIALPTAAGTTNRGTQRLRDAEEVLTMSVTAPDKGIPKDLLEKAECVGVFPGIAKGAFVVGGDYGHGVFTCRQPDGTMGAPAFFTMAGGSVGWQFGGEQADLVLLVMNPEGVKHMLADRFTLGADASAVAGPVGRTAKAATDAQLHAQILSWSRSRGAFLGASLEGNVVKPDAKTTEEFYGKPVSAREILVDRGVKTPKAAEPFVHLTNEYAKRTS
jgi:lipid-binding SYLF domain-containing protein